MVSYLAANSDPDDYGRLTLFNLERSRTIFGPTQVNARILANTTIASELTLLSQRGSRVLLGNLLIVPVKESLLYVQPIFVQGSAANSIPLLQRVAVYYNNSVGYASTLSEAVSQVVSGEAPPPAGGGGEEPPPPAGGETADVQQLLRQANETYRSAQQALADGNLGLYQQRVNRMAELIERALAAQGGGRGNAGGGGATTTATPTTTAPPG
jgi:uncharacterized membrane protein (UPF0182 family)